MHRLTTLEEVEEARGRLAAMMDAGGEWFLREGREGARVGLRRGEWEVRVAGGALVLSYWGEAGSRAWRVAAWGMEGACVVLDASRRTGAKRARLELVPRARVASAREAVADARRSACERVAALVCGATGATPERVALSAGARRGEPGRWTRIILRRVAARVAVAAPVVPVAAGDAEAFLASSLLWFSRLEAGELSRLKAGESSRLNAWHARELWLVVPRVLSSPLCERVALLRAELRAVLTLFELDEDGALANLFAPELDELLEAPAPRLYVPSRRSPSETAARVVALAPDSIDVVSARRGETLRFNGLAFARVRRTGDAESAWFGVEGAPRRRPLEDASVPDFLKLVGDLKEHRRHDATDRRHALYRAAPEAWLEALLRRDVTRLDPGLRLAPLHAQFRTARASGDAQRPVDLLALRRDGRLVVIELKVSEDAALALQGADYWRRIHTHHRASHIRRARLFGDAEISDDPPLVYLVAPLLRFHRAFHTLARAIRPDVEIYRFDINEDWRAGVRVARRVI